MWIESIHIGGFGVFCKAEISSLPPGLCLFIGDNEAGKSTLLAFIRFMLYGMSKKKSEDGNRYLPLIGGTHGGIIQVKTAQNKSIQVHRDFSNAAGAVTVFDDKNRAVGGSVFEDLLAGTNKELYRNVYGFSLQELQNLASLEADQIKSVLYGASMGAGILALPKAQKNLNDKIGEIFKPTGVLPRLNKKLIEVGEIRKCIEDIQNSLSVSKFDDINRQLKDLDTSLRNKQAKLVWQKEALDDVEKTIKHYGEWSRLLEKKKESSTLPDDSALFPEDCLSILEREIASFKVYSSNLEKAQLAHEDAQLEAESQVADSLMLQAGNEIADLRKDLRQSVLCFKELADFRNEASVAEMQLKEEVLKLGDGWDQERILRFSDLEKCGQTILGFQSRFAEISSKRKASVEFRDKCKVEFESALVEEERKRQYVEGLGPLPSLVERSKVQDLRDGFQKCDGEIHSVEEKKSEFRQGFESLQYLQQQVRERSGTKDALVLLPESCEDVRKAISAIKINRHILSRDKIEEFKEKVRDAEQKVSDADKDCSRCAQEIQSIDEKLSNLSLQLEAFSVPGSMVDSSVVDEVRRESGVLARLRDELEGLGKEVELKAVSETRAREMLGGQVKDADLLDESRLFELRKNTEQKIGLIGEKEKELAGVGARLSAAHNSQSETESECRVLESKVEAMRFRLGEEERLLAALAWCEKFDEVYEECERHRVRLNHLQERLNDKKASLGKVLEETGRKQQLQMSMAILAVGVLTGGGLFVLVNQLAGLMVVIAGVAAFFILRSRRVSAKEAVGDVEAEGLQKDVGQLSDELASVNKTLESSCGSLKELTEQLNVDGSVSAVKSKRETVEAELSDWKELKKFDLELGNLRKRLESQRLGIADLNGIAESINSEIEKTKLELRKCFEMVGAGATIGPQMALEKLSQLESLRQAKAAVIDAESRKKGVLSLIESSIRSLEKLTHLDGLDLVEAIRKVAEWLQNCPTEERSSREANNLRYSVKELEEKQKVLRVERNELEAIFNLARERAGKAKSAWFGHLDNHGIQSDLSFESGNKLCEYVDQAESTFQKLKTISEDLRNLEENVSNYFRLAEKLMQLKETGSLYDHLLEVRNFLTDCEKNEEVRKRHEKANADLEASKERLKASQERLELSERKLQESIREDEGSRNEVRSWLVERGLNSSMSPAAAYEAIQAVRSCKEIVNRVMTANADLKERELTVERFVARSKQLYKAIGRIIPETELLFGDLEDVAALFDAEQNKAGAHKKVRENLAARLEAKLKSESELKAAQGRVDGLLSKAKCQNEQEFRQRHAAHMRRRELVQQTASMEHSLCRVLDETDSASLEKRYGSFELAAAASKKVEFEREVSKLHEEIEGKLAADGEVTSGLRFDISRLQSEREVLIRSREMADLRLKLERTIAEAEALAREWTRLSIANALLQRAKNRFEHEGQPQVLELGSEFFSAITGNKYSGLNVNAKSKSNRLEAMIGKERIGAEVLSTGTQEQLYLSLRFGFIKHRGRTTEPLPVIMDDILVNFDPYRARMAAETIYRLSSSQQQILVFTCHPSTIDIFGKVAPSARTVEIKSGKLALLAGQTDGEGESSKPDWLRQKNIREFKG